MLTVILACKSADGEIVRKTTRSALIDLRLCAKADRIVRIREATSLL